MPLLHCEFSLRSSNFVVKLPETEIIDKLESCHNKQLLLLFPKEGKASNPLLCWPKYVSQSLPLKSYGDLTRLPKGLLTLWRKRFKLVHYKEQRIFCIIKTALERCSPVLTLAALGNATTNRIISGEVFVVKV